MEADRSDAQRHATGVVGEQVFPRKAQHPIELNLAYAFSRHLSVYADVINVFNVGTNHQYTYIRDRATRNDLYTTVIKFGLSGSF